MSRACQSACVVPSTSAVTVLAKVAAIPPAPVPGLGACNNACTIAGAKCLQECLHQSCGQVPAIPSAPGLGVVQVEVLAQWWQSQLYHIHAQFLALVHARMQQTIFS